MPLGFKHVRRRGHKFDLASFAFRRLKGMNLALKSSKEHDYELKVVTRLQGSNRLEKHLITQTEDGEVEKIHRSYLFGFHHKPDVAIGRDGTAIEVKVVSSSPQIREALGQAIAYRMDYNFVILVLVDRTAGGQIVKRCREKSSQEHNLLSSLAKDFNVLSIVGPKSKGKNVHFS
jgi:hypothetical protein